MKSHVLERHTDWVDLIPGQSASLDVSIGDYAYGWGTLLHGDNTSQFRIDWYGTDDNHLRQGYGRLILQTMAEEASSKGASIITGHFVSEESLATIADTFGSDNLTFYDHGTHEPTQVNLETALQHPDLYTTEVSLS